MTCAEVREFLRSHPDPLECTVAETLAVWSHCRVGAGCLECCRFLGECPECVAVVYDDPVAAREHSQKCMRDPEYRKILGEAENWGFAGEGDRL